MTNSAYPEGKLIQLMQEKRLNSSDRISVVLDVDFYIRPLNHNSHISSEEKHSSHTIDISSEGFGFLYPAKPSLDDDYRRSGSISKNAVLEVYLYFDNKRFRFYAQRAWAQMQCFEDARYFRYGVKWFSLDDSQTLSLKYILDSLKNKQVVD